MSSVQNGLNGIVVLFDHHPNPLSLQRIIAVQINQADVIAEAGKAHPWSLGGFIDFIETLGQVLDAVEGGNPAAAKIVAQAALGKIPADVTSTASDIRDLSEEA